MSSMELSVRQAKAQFDQVLKRVAAGEVIIITRAGIPVARLEPVRPLGKDRGKIWIADDFDAPLPPDILAGFLGEDSPSEKPETKPGTKSKRARRRKK
jgi:prevent-host-death family protein